MSGDLKTQVRDYTEFFMGTVESIDLEEIKERPFRLEEGPVQPLASPRRHRGWLVAVAGAVAVLVLGLLTLLTRQTVPEAPVASQPSPSPTVTTPAPVPSTPIEGSASGWSQVLHDEAVFGGAMMWSVTAGGPGLVAVGGEDIYFWSPEDIAPRPESGEDADAVVWTSPDGVSWSRVPDDAVFGGNGEQQMFSVTTGGPGLVAVGFDGTLGNEEGNAAVWTSPNGFTWSRVPHDEAVFGGAGVQRMLSVAAGGPGLVAVGFETAADGDPADAVVWTSPDGIIWSRVHHDEAVFGGAGTQKMLSVTTGGPGLVAVGNDGNTAWFDPPSDEPAADAAVWTSPDGIIWSRVPHDDTVFGGAGEQRMLGVTSGGPGLVAVGSVAGDNTMDAAVWTSPDGLTWSRVPHDKAVFAATECRVFCDGSTFEDTHEEMRSVTAGGPGLIAVGSNGIEQGGWDGAVWTSPDGITWSKVLNNLAPFHHSHYDLMSSVAATESGLTVVGRAADVAPAYVAATVWHSSGKG